MHKNEEGKQRNEQQEALTISVTIAANCIRNIDCGCKQWEKNVILMSKCHFNARFTVVDAGTVRKQCFSVVQIRLGTTGMARREVDHSIGSAYG